MARDQACFLGLFALAGVLAARFARADGVPPVVVKTLTVDAWSRPTAPTRRPFTSRCWRRMQVPPTTSQQTIGYSDSMETVKVVEAFTRKTDGVCEMV